MQQPEQLLVEPLLYDYRGSRRKLLPLWMKVFIWMFLILGALAPLGILAGFFGINFQVALYGLESNNPLSPVGLFLTLLFLFKGVVAFSLWTEKDWAVVLGIIDAAIGVAVCTFVMLVAPFLYPSSGINFNFKLELVALIPYLIKLRRIKPLWNHMSNI